MNKFYIGTDSVDIDARSLGVHGPGYDSRGLCIQIRHNYDKDLFLTAAIMQDIIVDALNHAIKSGRLILPEIHERNSLRNEAT